MTEAVSRMFFGRDSEDESLLRSGNATARFRSVASDTRTLLCHLRSLYSSMRWSAVTDFVPDGRSRQSIIVDRPLSWIVKVIGAPVRARFARCSSSNQRHSGGESAIFSATTYPDSMHGPAAVS